MRRVRRFRGGRASGTFRIWPIGKFCSPCVALTTLGKGKEQGRD